MGGRRSRATGSRTAFRNDAGRFAQANNPVFTEDIPGYEIAMKKHLIALVLAAGLLATGGLRAATVDFTDFAGRYRGTYIALINNTDSLAGKVTVEVDVPRNGNSAVIRLNGFATGGGSSAPVAATLRMKRNGRLKSDSLLMGLLGPNPITPTRFSGRKSKFRFTLFPRSGAMIGGEQLIGRMTYRMKFTNDALIIEGAGTVNETPLPLKISIDAHK